MKKLTISIEPRLYNISNNSKIFAEASKHCQKTVNQFGYEYNLQYKLPNNESKIRSKLPKNRKKNILWFNSPFPRNVYNNICKYFVLLIQKHFLNNHKYRKIFNKNNVKISYSCMANIKSIINMHNKEVSNDGKKQKQ